MNQLYTLLFVLVFSITAQAQSACSTAVEVTPAPELVTKLGDFKNGDRQYFKFVATTTAVQIHVQPSNGTVLTRLYPGCNASFLKASEEKLIAQDSLVPGNTYYYELYALTATSTFAHGVVSFTPDLNDNCSGATEITPSATYVGTSGDFNKATPSVYRYEGSDVWYKFKATTKAATIRVVPSNFSYATIEIFDSCGKGDIGTAASGNELTQGGLTIGKTYYYRFYGSNVTRASSFTTGVIALSNRPANDECENATEVIPAATYTSLSGNFTNATPSWPTWGPDVWYKFKPTTNAVIIKLTTINTTANVELFSGCNGKKIATGIANGNTSEIRLGGLVAGQTYYYHVSPSYFPVPANASFTHGVVTIANTVANDECANATEITPKTVYTPQQGNFANATPSLYSRFGTYDSSAYDDVWYKFVASSKVMRIQVVPTNAKVGIQLFKNCGGTPYSFGARTDTLRMTSGGYEVGKTYYYKIYSQGAPTSTSSFTHGVVPITNMPANDACEDAQTIVPSATVNWTHGTLKNATGGFGAGGLDVWYKFVATSTSVTIYHQSCHWEPYVAVYDGCSGYLLGSHFNEPYQLNDLVVGKTYYYLLSTGMGYCPESYDISTAVVLDNVTGLETEELLLPSVYPNPTQGSFTIRSGAENISGIFIYDAQGQLVRTLEATETVLVSPLSKGLYSVQFVTVNGNSRTVKLVVE